MSKPMVEHYRKCIADCICPECGAGPFKSMSKHSNQAHGIDRHEIRRRAEYPVRWSIASSELSEESAERAKDRGAVKAMNDHVDKMRGQSVKREVPDYSRRIVSEGLSAYMLSLGPGERAARVEAVRQGQAKRRKPCGTDAAYRRGCRCEPCRAAKRDTRPAKGSK